MKKNIKFFIAFIVTFFSGILFERFELDNKTTKQNLARVAGASWGGISLVSHVPLLSFFMNLIRIRVPW